MTPSGFESATPKGGPSGAWLQGGGGLATAGCVLGKFAVLITPAIETWPFLPGEAVISTGKPSAGSGFAGLRLA